ncbi:uncharacterized protein LOC144105423 [Amblyomma americanum]
MKKSKPAREANRGGDKKKPGFKQITADVEGLLGEDHDAPKPKNLFDGGATTAVLTKHRPSILDVRKKAKKAPAKPKKHAAAEIDKQSQNASKLAVHASPGPTSATAVKGGGAMDGKKAAADDAQRRRSGAEGGVRDKTGEMSAPHTAMHSSVAPGSGQSAIAVSSGGTSRVFYICAAVVVLAMVVLAGTLVALLSKKYIKKPVTATSSLKADAEAQALRASSSPSSMSSFGEEYG